MKNKVSSLAQSSVFKMTNQSNLKNLRHLITVYWSVVTINDSLCFMLFCIIVLPTYLIAQFFSVSISDVDGGGTISLGFDVGMKVLRSQVSVSIYSTQ